MSSGNWSDPRAYVCAPPGINSCRRAWASTDFSNVIAPLDITACVMQPPLPLPAGMPESL